MKPLYLLATAGILLLATESLSAQTYKAILTGRGEVPPVVTMGYGEVTAELDEDTLTVSGFFRNLTGDFAANIAGGSHIHTNYAGRNGGIAHGLVATVDMDLKGGTWEAASNRIVLTAEQKDMLAERSLYVNVHTTFSTSGEIRGQLIPMADSYFMSTMLGSYENPAVPSRGRGALVLDLVGDTLTVSGTFNGLSSPLNVAAAGGMHLHTGIAGMNGGISIGLTVTADTTGMNGVVRAADNRYTLTADQKTALMQRRFYANVHSTNFGGGELRGQVTGVSLAVFRAHLSGMNENPFVPSRAGGLVIAELGMDSTLWVSGSFAGIASGVATDVAGGSHIHLGVAGRNGGIQFPLNSDLNMDGTDGTFAVDSNMFKLGDDDLEALMNRMLYVNVHSHLVRSGEIRGQLLPESQLVFNANISSVTSLPPVRSAGGGLVKGELNGNQLILSGSFAGLGTEVDTNIAGGAHLHIGPAGSTGPVIFPLDMRFTGADLREAVLGNNSFMLTDDQVLALLGRGLYINVHTLNHPSGEIRGQLLPEAHTYFFASLAGSHETNPIRSGAIGQVILEFQRNGSAITSGSFRDLEGDLAVNIAGGAHIHAGLNGQNGPVLIPIVATPSPDMRSGLFIAADNAYQISAGLADTLFALGLYVNVHSAFSQSGEIRGQLLPAANAHFNAVLRAFNEVQPIAGNGAHGSVSAILTGGVLRVSGAFADLEGDFASNIAGGSHIHTGRAGFNGGIAVSLGTRIAGDLKSGVYRADTLYMPTAEQISNLLSGGMYVNVHTTMYGGGELRGQLLSNFNAFPNAMSEITQPVPNTTVNVSSTSQEILMISWTASSDPNQDSIAYIVQVTPDPTFTTIPIQFNTANQRAFNSLTLAFIDTLLATAGIPIGFPLPVNARIIASDGSLTSIGQAFSFMVVRQPPSAVRDLPDGWTFDVYPTLVSDRINVEISAPGSSDLQVVLFSSDGQGKQVQEVTGTGGDAFNAQVDVSDCTSGLWILGLMDNGQLVGQHKVLVIR